MKTNYKLIEHTYREQVIPVRNMKVGQIAKIVKWEDNQINYVGNWVLRCHKHLISLSNPQYVWIDHLDTLSNSFMVRLLDESEELVLIGVNNNG